MVEKAAWSSLPAAGKVNWIVEGQAEFLFDQLCKTAGTRRGWPFAKLPDGSPAAEERLRSQPHQKEKPTQGAKRLPEENTALKIPTSDIYILKRFQKRPFCANLFSPPQRLNLTNHSSTGGCCSDIMTVSGTDTLMGGNEAILSDADTENLASASELPAVWTPRWDFFCLCFETTLLQFFCAPFKPLRRNIFSSA